MKRILECFNDLKLIKSFFKNSLMNWEKRLDEFEICLEEYRSLL